MTKSLEQLTKQLDKLANQVTKLEQENKGLKQNQTKQEPDKKTLQQAKDNVPELKDRDSYVDFIYYLKKFLNLKPKLRDFIDAIKLPDTKKVTSLSQLYDTNKDALDIALRIDDSEMHDFNTWIVSKIHKSIDSLHKRVDDEKSVAEQVLELWYNILKRFNRNSDAAREAHQRGWDHLKQSD